MMSDKMRRVKSAVRPDSVDVARTGVVACRFDTGEAVELTMRDGVIERIAAVPEPAGRHLPFVAPGLVDLQINGYAGLDFNADPLSPETVKQATRKLWSRGVTTYYPTVITNGAETISRLLAAIAAACREDAATANSIGGIHLEGPFLSPEDGARGAHNRAFVRPPDWRLFERWQSQADGRIAIVTISPEWPEAPDFIRRCADSGVVVSIGHTAATPEQIRDAVSAGAKMSTHLGNGAHLMLPRHPNYIWEQLADDRLVACLIADGFHLPEAFLKVALRAKGERAVFVSDAVALSGLAPGTYETAVGGEAVLTPEGRLHTKANPQILAGSAQQLVECVEHAARVGLAPLPAAWTMASTRPAALTGLAARAGLAAGAPADFVLFELTADGKIVIGSTYKQGTPVYGAK